MIKNAKLQNVFKLSSKISLYIPSTVNVDQAIDNTTYVDRTASLFSDLFGGSTSTKALGYWMSSNSGLVKEKTTIVFSYCTTDQLEQNSDKVVDFAISLKKEMNQEAIALEINGELYLI